MDKLSIEPSSLWNYIKQAWTFLIAQDLEFWKETVLWIIGIYFGWKLFVYVMRRVHLLLKTKKLRHLRITLPKNDSKLDNEKRTEKDFHEAIGKMEQFFRAMHETKDLTLYNKLIRWKIWGEPFFSFEYQFQSQQMEFVIVCDPYYENILQKQITSFYSSANIEPIPEEEQLTFDAKKESINGFHVFTEKKYWYPVQTYKKIEDDPLNSLANSFAKLEQTEKGVIQIVIHPVSHKWQKKAHDEGERLYKGKAAKSSFHIPLISPILRIIWFPFKILIRGFDPATDNLGQKKQGGDPLVRMLQAEEEIYKSIGEKSMQSGFKTSIRVMASSPTANRVEQILNGLFVAFNIFKAKGGNRFEYRRIIPLNGINAPWINYNFRKRLPAGILEKESLLCSEEIATLFHFPDARYNRIPTIKWLAYKVLPPPIDLPDEGIIIGESIYRGVSKLVRFMREDRTRHQYVLGKSGSGKSVLLWNQAIQDIAAGEGVCVIDPHGDLVEDIASCVPKERAKDVLVFDPGDRERPMGLNILEATTPEEQERASMDAMEIFIKLFGNEIFGPRIQHYFRNGCLTLMADEDEGATLIDIPRLFIDDDFQRYKVAKIKNVVVRAFWENEMANTGEREKQEMIPYFTSKFGPFVTNTTMRNIIGQTKSAFNVREAMDNQKILLINLSKGKIGAINSQLIGLIMVAKINQAAMGRADMPAKDRKDFYFYVDEFQNFATDTFAGILSEARKYRLNLIMAHQYIAQLSEGAGGISQGKDSKVRDAVFGNVGSMMSFKVGADDAEFLEKEYAPDLSAQDILSMANYKAYVKLNIHNTTSRPFSIATLYDPSLKKAKVLEIIKKYSRMKYGRKKEFVDAEIEARMGIDNLSKITESAKKDPTVNDNLLKDKPMLHNEADASGVAGGAIADQVAAAPTGSVFDPSKIPTMVQTHHEDAIIHPSTENVLGNNAPMPSVTASEPVESRAIGQPSSAAPNTPEPPIVQTQPPLVPTPAEPVIVPTAPEPTKQPIVIQPSKPPVDPPLATNATPTETPTVPEVKPSQEN